MAEAFPEWRSEKSHRREHYEEQDEKNEARGLLEFYRINHFTVIVRTNKKRGIVRAR